MNSYTDVICLAERAAKSNVAVQSFLDAVKYQESSFKLAVAENNLIVDPFENFLLGMDGHERYSPFIDSDYADLMLRRQKNIFIASAQHRAVFEALVCVLQKLGVEVDW